MAEREIVRAIALGFFIFAVGCAGRPGPAELARRYDRADGTGLYTWLVGHEPSAIVAWHAPVGRLHDVVPDARIVISLEANPCALAIRERAEIVTLSDGKPGGGRLERALDCGIPLYRDGRGLAIAPR